MKARVKWLDGMMMVGESASGHAVVMDGPPDHGGRNLGVRPMEMVLIGLRYSCDRRNGAGHVHRYTRIYVPRRCAQRVGVYRVYGCKR